MALDMSGRSRSRGSTHFFLVATPKRVAVPFDDITAVEYQRGEVRIDRRAAATLFVGSLDAPGALLELTHRLATLTPLLQ